MKLSIACLCLLSASLAAAASPNLIPANMSNRGDSQGFNWDINQNGQVRDGTSDCFDGAINLIIGGNHFQCNQPMMLADGSEFVLTGQMGDLQVTRRIKLDKQAAVCRYVEIIENTSSSQIDANILIHSQLGGNCQAVYTDTGTAGSVLSKQDGGIFAFQQVGHSRPSVAWLLAAPNSKFKPQVVVSNNRDFNFTWTLPIPAGRTVTLVHAVAQRRLQTQPDAASMTAMFKPWHHRSFIADLPTDIRRTVINGNRSMLGIGGGIGTITLESLDVQADSHAVLALGPETRMQGQLGYNQLTVRNDRGTVTIASDDLAAIVGGRHHGTRNLVLLRDGQVLKGTIIADTLRFTLLSGTALDLDIKRIDRLVMPVSSLSEEIVPEAGTFVTTADGEHLKLGDAADTTIELITAWASFTVPIEDIRWLGPAPEGMPGYQVVLRDSSRFIAYIGSGEIALNTKLYGTLTISPAYIHAINRVTPGHEDKTGDEEIDRPHIILAGGNVLVGRIDSSTLRLRAGGEEFPIPPEQIRLLTRQNDNPIEVMTGTMFHAELWGGDAVLATISDPVLHVRVRGVRCTIPLSAVNEVVVPHPAMPDEIRIKVADLIRDLGHAEWERREEATQALADLGMLAIEALKAAHDESADPEVRYRANALLERLE